MGTATVSQWRGIVRFPHPTVSTVIMKTEPYKHYIEIMPAALLSQRRAWQKAAQTLPVGACLLVTNPNDKAQTKFMDELTQLFRQRGKRVFIWKSRKALDSTKGL